MHVCLRTNQILEKGPVVVSMTPYSIHCQTFRSFVLLTFPFSLGSPELAKLYVFSTSIFFVAIPHYGMCRTIYQLTICSRIKSSHYLSKGSFNFSPFPAIYGHTLPNILSSICLTQKKVSHPH